MEVSLREELSINHYVSVTSFSFHLNELQVVFFENHAVTNSVVLVCKHVKSLTCLVRSYKKAIRYQNYSSFVGRKQQDLCLLVK